PGSWGNPGYLHSSGSAVGGGSVLRPRTTRAPVGGGPAPDHEPPPRRPPSAGDSADFQSRSRLIRREVAVVQGRGGGLRRRCLGGDLGARGVILPGVGGIGGGRVGVVGVGAGAGPGPGGVGLAGTRLGTVRGA